MNYCLNPYCKNAQNADDVTLCSSCNSTIILDNRYRPIKFIGGGDFVSATAGFARNEEAIISAGNRVNNLRFILLPFSLAKYQP